MRPASAAEPLVCVVVGGPKDSASLRFDGLLLAIVNHGTEAATEPPVAATADPITLRRPSAGEVRRPNTAPAGGRGATSGTEAGADGGGGFEAVAAVSVEHLEPAFDDAHAPSADGLPASEADVAGSRDGHRGAHDGVGGGDERDSDERDRDERDRDDDDGDDDDLVDRRRVAVSTDPNAVTAVTTHETHTLVEFSSFSSDGSR